MAIKRVAGGYLFIQGLNVALDLVRNLAVAAMLGPANMGFCLTLLIVPQVAQYLNLGLNESLMIVVPQYRAMRNPQMVKQIKEVVFNATLWISLLSFFTVVVYTIFFRPGHTQSNYFLILAGSLIVFWEIRQFFIVNYTAEKQFKALCIYELVYSILVASIQIGLIYYLTNSNYSAYRSYGFWFGFILPPLIVILWATSQYRRHYPLHLFFPKWAECSQLIPLGIGLLAASVAYAPFLILARVFLAYGVGMEEVGYFLLAMSVITKLSIIPSSVAKIITPHLAFDYYEKEANLNGIFRRFWHAQFYTLLLSCGIILPAFFLIKPAVQWLLPTYAPGIGAAKIMLVAVIPYCLIDNANNLLLVLRQKKLYFFNLAASIVFAALLSAWFLYTGSLSSSIMAVVFLITFCFYSLFLNGCLFKLSSIGAKFLQEESVNLMT